MMAPAQQGWGGTENTLGIIPTTLVIPAKRSASRDR